MPKHRVLDVGNCSPDHNSIKRLIQSSFDAEVVQSHLCEDTLECLRSEHYDLVLINRKLDQDYSDGMEVLKAIKLDPNSKCIPVMLITNHAEHQESAVSHGALRGFGKLEFGLPETMQKLAAVLR